MPSTNPQPAAPKTRQAILDLLKREGPQDSGSLAARLGLTPMAIRQHLYDLRRRKLAEFSVEPRPRGRPAKRWALTPAADRFFPDAHAELAVGILDALRGSFGTKGIDTLLAERTRRQIEAYREEIPAGAPLRRRVEALADIRTREGYMAETRQDPGGALLLIENHCPVCAAAAACQGLCVSELEVFRAALGPKVLVERTEHILAGSRRCVYRVAPR